MRLRAFWLSFLSAVLFHTPSPAAESSASTHDQLRSLFEACRTKALVRGGFPKGYRELEPLLNGALSRDFLLRVEFHPPERKDNLLRRHSPVGERTPCLRLKISADRWLNVAGTGWIYESGEYWESEFVHLLPRPFMAINLLEKDSRPMPARVSGRSPRCGPAQLELAKCCNAIPTIPWFQGPNQEFAAPGFGAWIGTGVHEYQGVLFDVRGVIQVDGLVVPEEQGSRNITAYPKAVRQIPVKQSIRTLHLLAGTIEKAPPESIVAQIELHFASGASEKLALRYGVHVSAADDDKPAPHRLPRAAGAPLDFYSLHYFRLNPARAGEVVQSIDFISGETTSHPFLMGVTIEP